MEGQEKVFKELKERFTKELMLAAPDLDKKNKDGYQTWFTLEMKVYKMNLEICELVEQP